MVWHGGVATVRTLGVNATELSLQYTPETATRLVFLGAKSAGGGEVMADNDVLQRLGAVERGLADVRADTAAIKTQMGNVATKAWVLGGALATLLAVVASIFGAAGWVVQQLMAPLMQAAGGG